MWPGIYPTCGLLFYMFLHMTYMYIMSIRTLNCLQLQKRPSPRSWADVVLAIWVLWTYSCNSFTCVSAAMIHSLNPISTVSIVNIYVKMKTRPLLLSTVIKIIIVSEYKPGGEQGSHKSLYISKLYSFDNGYLTTIKNKLKEHSN